MTRTEALLATITFALTSAAAAIGRLAYEMFVLGHTDDKLGTPAAQFQLMAGIHCITAATAAIGFAAVVMLPGIAVARKRAAFLLAALAGMSIGVLPVARASRWLDAILPFRGVLDDVVSVLLVGAAVGMLVRLLSTSRRMVPVQ